MQGSYSPQETQSQLYCARADQLLAQAAHLITLARCEDVAPETLRLLQNLLDGIRVPLRRLGGVQ
jgi:hypothetical protein